MESFGFEVCTWLVWMWCGYGRCVHPFCAENVHWLGWTRYHRSNTGAADRPFAIMALSLPGLQNLYPEPEYPSTHSWHSIIIDDLVYTPVHKPCFVVIALRFAYIHPRFYSFRFCSLYLYPCFTALRHHNQLSPIMLSPHTPYTIRMHFILIQFSERRRWRGACTFDPISSFFFYCNNLVKNYLVSYLVYLPCFDWYRMLLTLYICCWTSVW